MAVYYEIKNKLLVMFRESYDKPYKWFILT